MCTRVKWAGREGKVENASIALRGEDSATRLGSRCFRANPEMTLESSELYHLENDHDEFTLKVDRGAWRLIATMVGQEELLTPTRVVVNQLSAQCKTNCDCILMSRKR